MTPQERIDHIEKLLDFRPDEPGHEDVEWLLAVARAAVAWRREHATGGTYDNLLAAVDDTPSKEVA